ncbi:MAG: (Fe-S)-binding protein [Candidatus Gastranaerophilales bacterium]|nr:(Fe-S)-binding protein [Candidatus Gastranaerophilales bacterium]
MLDEDIKKNIQKCARCALCVQNCPIYSIKKDENNTARGLVCKLLGYQKQILSEKEIKKDLKICLNCSKCKTNCPSKVDTTSVFAYKNAEFNPSKISQRLFLMAKLFPIKVLYFLNFFKKTPKNIFSSNVLYFKGCISKAQHKKTFLDYALNNPNFACCGLPYLTSGDLKNYNKAKKKNIELIKNASLVVFDCASCKSAVMEYPELDEEDKKKLTTFVEFEKRKFKLKDNSKYKNKVITFHKPCHMNNNDFNLVEEFLSSIDGLNYKRLDNIDTCCGFGGSYFVFHPIIATKIALKKARDIKNSKADLILTMCPSCTLGLRYNQLASFNFKKTLELRDFIDCELSAY